MTINGTRYGSQARWLFTTVMLGLAAATAASAAPLVYQNDVLADNPVLYYQFGETSGTTAADASTNAWDGAYVGSPTFGQTGAGAGSDNAVLFDGATDYIAVTSTADNGTVGASAAIGSMLNAVSFEAVFSTTTTSTDYLFGTANTGSTTNFGIGFNENFAGQTRLFIRDEDGVNILGEFSDASVFDGNFHHLMYTYDSAGASPADRMKAYLDGNEITLNYRITGQPDNFANSEFPLLVGANNNRGASHRWFDGAIDELAIYDSILTATDAFDRFNALGIVVPNQWNVDGGGSFNTAGNWLDNVVPTANALFGTTLASGDAEVTLDSGVSLNSVTFNNSNNQYTLAGSSTLTLIGDAQVSTTGTHVISANIAGSAGLTKVGGGTLSLTGAKAYTGTTDVQEGTLLIDNLDAIDNQATGVINLAPGATVNLAAGAAGTLAAELTGGSSVDGDAALRINDAVTISRANSSYGGVVRVDGGTLSVGDNNALGTGGVSNNRTVVQAGTTAKVALTGGVTIASEVLDFEGRSTADAALTSSGNNAWNGVIRGEGNNTLSQLNIESTSGTLTLSQLHAQDSGSQFTYVFSGAGNTTVTDRISDFDIDIGPNTILGNDTNNVNVVKRGSGTLTIGYANADIGGEDYWYGYTSILEGTMVVNSSGGTDGELRSSSIEIESGATLNISAFTEYTQQIGQAITGSGSINVGSGNLRLIDVSSVAPGDSPGKVGTLTVTSGTVTLPDLALGGGGVWKFDIGNSSNSTGDRLNVQSGSFTAGTSGITVNVTPAYGTLDAGFYTIVSHTGGANSTLNSATAQIADANGNVLTTRQTVAINGDTAGQVNVEVSGAEASRTWNGNVSSAWDVSTSNWVGGADQQFRDLDHVTFNDSAATKDVTLAENRSPGSITFANSSPYTVSGEGSIVSTGTLDVTGTGKVSLANAGNSFGAVTINSGGSLQTGSASTGSITNSGTLSLGVEETVPLLVQNGAEEIGTGANYKVFAYEAEDFIGDVTTNLEGTATWEVRTDVAGSSGAGASGEALYATEETSNGSGGSLGNQNYVTYDMKFTEPGVYTWFHRMVSVDGGDGNSTPDMDPGNDDSFWTVSGDMDSGNTDPTVLGSRIENFGSGSRQNAEGTDSDAFVYDWYRNAGSNEFDHITVTQADVDAGAVFSFKVGTREGGMTLDKFAFVAIDDVANFGSTLLDADLDGATSIAITQETFTASGTVLDINGDFTMAPGSTLNMLISTPDTHDLLNVSGMLTADGTLNIAAGGNGFGAEEGDVFDVFDFASVTGMFNDILLPSLNAGLGWNTDNLLVDGTLSVISVGLPGDFNFDNIVDAADYAVWRNGLGTTYTMADYDTWRLNYGQSLATVADSSAAAPEPTAALCCLVLGVLTAGRRRRLV